MQKAKTEREKENIIFCFFKSLIVDRNSIFLKFYHITILASVKRWLSINFPVTPREAVEIVSEDEEVPRVVDQMQTCAQIPKSPNGPTINVREVHEAPPTHLPLLQP